MKFKEFEKWCNERASDGRWGSVEAIICINVINEICGYPFWMREKRWKALSDEIVNEIVNPINEMIERMDNKILLHKNHITEKYITSMDVAEMDTKGIAFPRSITSKGTGDTIEEAFLDLYNELHRIKHSINEAISSIESGTFVLQTLQIEFKPNEINKNEIVTNVMNKIKEIKIGL